MKTGYIYFVHADGTNRYKIGLTVDLDRRMRELNGKQAPFENKLLWSIEVSDMRSAEKDLHDMFSNRRVNGEWFLFDESELSGVEDEYDRISDKYPVHQYQPEPTYQQTHYYFDSDDSNHGVQWIGAGILAIAFAAWFAFATGHGFKMPKFPATANSVQTSKKANVRAVPNGRILCELPANKAINVSSEENNGWHKTDACGDLGVIHESVIKH